MNPVQIHPQSQNLTIKEKIQPTSEVIRSLYLSVKEQYPKIVPEETHKFRIGTFAEIIGINYNTVTCWIRGTRNPPAYVVEMIKERIVKAGYTLPE